MSLVYLAGPIKGLDYETAMGWRQEVAQSLSLKPAPFKGLRATGIHCLNPMRDKGTAIDESGLLTKARHIYSRDLNDVRRCDVFLANFLNVPAGHVIGGGTFWEIGVAHERGTPIVMCITEDSPYYHPLPVFSAGFVVETLEDGITAVKSLLGV